MSGTTPRQPSRGFACAARFAPRPGAVRVALTWALLAGFVPAAAGQESEPSPFVLTNRRGYVEFFGERREQNQKTKTNTGDLRSKERVFRESFRLDVDGYVYHPNLLDFTAGGLFGLLQHSFTQTPPTFAGSGSENGTLWEYNFQGDILKRKPFPGSVYAERREGLEPRLFRPSVQTTMDHYGATWQYVSKKAPTRVQFDYRDITLHPLGGQEEDGRRKNLNFRFDTAYHFSDHNSLSLAYEHQRVSERPFDLDYDSDEARVAHRLEFGRQHQHKLESKLEYLDQRGTLNLERLRWREQLRLKHTETLRSWFDFELLDQTRGSTSGIPPIQEQSYRALGAIEHRLFESLVSQANAFILHQEFKSGTEVDRYGGELRFDYRKNNPLGVLRADYDLRYETEDRQGGLFQSEVRDERHAFREAEPIALGNANIDTASIFVTADDGFTVFQLGRDYLIRTYADRVEIERVPTGRIAVGQTIVIDYIFRFGGTFRLDTLGQNAGLRHDFTFGLSPYYRLRRQDQSLSPISATGAVPEDIQSHIVGAEQRWKGFDFGAEYEDLFSTISPYEATRLRAGYNHHFKNGASAGVRVGWSDVAFGPPRDRDTEFFSLEGHFHQPLFKQVTLEGNAIYRKVHDNVSGPNDGVDLRLSLEWFVRGLELRVTYEYEQFDDRFARNDSSALLFQIRRKF